ncbi:MAG: hypothetical protein K9L30_08240 [Desulfobacterales bacterium]|nr:hypothetical protein [Desulfobacterales bacterium]
MNEIFITTDGVVYHEHKAVSDILCFLGYRITMDNSFTLRSFFRTLERYPVLKKLNNFIPSFIEEYNASPDKACFSDTVEYFQIGKIIEMTGFPGNPGIETYITLQGIKDDKTIDIKSLWLSNMLDMLLQQGFLKHIIFGDKIDTFTFDTSFNLFEFIDGIAWALSFHNMPAECRLKSDF